MTKRILLLSILVFSLLISCEDDKITNPKPTDCVKVWMTKNLDVDHYRNGDLIPEVKDSAEWVKLTTGAWCYYNNDPEMEKIYGKLYNWYAVNDPRGLAPEGWHVPSNAEWIVLTDSSGGPAIAGGKLKTTGTIEGGDGLWYSPNGGATNSSGFSALPGGWRNSKGKYYNTGDYGLWWSATESSAPSAWYRSMNFAYSNMHRTSDYKVLGMSVRCVRD